MNVKNNKRKTFYVSSFSWMNAEKLLVSVKITCKWVCNLFYPLIVFFFLFRKHIS